MPQIRVVHASDLHFGFPANQVGIMEVFKTAISTDQLPWPLPPDWDWVSTHDECIADAFARWIEAASDLNLIDLFIFTGDLATRGRDNDLLAAHHYLFSPRAKGYLNFDGKPTLQTSKAPICLIPGNHDRFGSFHWPGNLRFDDIFKTHWNGGQGVHRLYDQDINGIRLLILGADFSLHWYDWGTTLPVPGFLGQGRAYQPVIDELVRMTQERHDRDAECVILWAIHFEPKTEHRSLELLDEKKLENAVNQFDPPIDAILCGHSHNTDTSKLLGVTPVFVSGTVAERSRETFPVREFLLLTIDQEPNERAEVKAQTYRYDHRVKEFQLELPTIQIQGTP